VQDISGFGSANATLETTNNASSKTFETFINYSLEFLEWIAACDDMFITFFAIFNSRDPVGDGGLRATGLERRLLFCSVHRGVYR
jgi:hypothetical protein